MGGTAANNKHAWVRASWKIFLDLLFPPTCRGCGRRGITWCAECQQAVQTLHDPLCAQCGAPTRSNARLCSQCRHIQPELRSRSYALYRPPISTAILHLKYRPNRSVASLMGNWLTTVYQHTGWSATLVIPVPLAPDRLRQRGYNQAALISQAVADQARLEHRPQGLLRIRRTRSQVGLGYAERARNVTGAFAPAAAMDRELVLLVDDLYTTGATLRACCQACLQAGAAKVYGVTVARAGGRKLPAGS
jgi:ComF family protein